MKIPFIKVRIITEKTLKNTMEKIKKSTHDLHGNDTRHIHELICDKARLLFERAELIKVINILRTRAPGKPKKPDSQN